MSPLTSSPFTILDNIDEELINHLIQDEIEDEKILDLISQREKCLDDIAKLNIEPEKDAWLLAIKRTEYIYSLLNAKRDIVSKQAHSLIKGKKLNQTYQKF